MLKFRQDVFRKDRRVLFLIIFNRFRRMRHRLYFQTHADKTSTNSNILKSYFPKISDSPRNRRRCVRKITHLNSVFGFFWTRFNKIVTEHDLSRCPANLFTSCPWNICPRLEIVPTRNLDPVGFAFRYRPVFAVDRRAWAHHLQQPNLAGGCPGLSVGESPVMKYNMYRRSASLNPPARLICGCEWVH